MDSKQLRNSGILVVSNLVINGAGFLGQVIMAWALGVSADVDLLLLAMIVPAIIQSMIGGGAGEVLVIKRESDGFSEGSFETLFLVLCMVPVMVLGAACWLLAGQMAPLFRIDEAGTTLFTSLTLVFVINMLPSTVTSVLRPHLYAKGLYRFYAISVTVSHLAGLVFIAATVSRLGIYAFALGTLFTGIITAVWFSLGAGLTISSLFSAAVWRHEARQLSLLLKRVFSLSLQTLINHFATFWERSLSVRYLTPGYLSALNYAKTITELPNAVLLSSVLTTSYIEQANLHRDDNSRFASYTATTLRLLLRAGFLFQALMLLVAPAIIILIFRRGRFDNDAVTTTMVIFNILTAGFMPRLIFSYLSRTMYILGEYRRLLYTVIARFALQVGVMVAFISGARHAIPFAITVAFMASSLILYYIVQQRIKLPSLASFARPVIIASIGSAGLLWLHLRTIGLYIGMSNSGVLLVFLPLLLLSALIVLIFLRRNNLEPPFLRKINFAPWKKAN